MSIILLAKNLAGKAGRLMERLAKKRVAKVRVAEWLGLVMGWLLKGERRGLLAAPFV
jgi:hypothetical protein